MFPRHSIVLNDKKGQEKVDPVLRKKFFQAVDFVKWSSQETKLFSHFQKVISNQIFLTQLQTHRIAKAAFLDKTLQKSLLKLTIQIKQNILLFQDSSPVDYSKLTENRFSTKISLVIHTSSQTIKNLCQIFIFLHFISENLYEYKKIIKQFQEKCIRKKIQKEKNKFKFFLGCKIYTAIALILLKFSVNQELFQILDQAIKARIQYQNWSTQQRKESDHQFRASSTSNTKKPIQINFISTTLYLIYQKIKCSISLKKDPYEIMTFVKKYEYYAKTQKQKQRISQNQYQTFSQNITKLSHSVNQKITNCRQIIDKSYLDDEEEQPEKEKVVFSKKRYQSLEQKVRSCSEQTISQKLSKKYFGKNKKSFQINKVRCLSNLQFRRTKIKIMEELFKNNMQNTRKALVKVELQMKTNKSNFRSNQNNIVKEMSDKKIKKKRIKKDLYQKFKNSKNIVCDLTSKLLEKEIFLFKQINIWNKKQDQNFTYECLLNFQIKHKQIQIHSSQTQFNHQDKGEKIEVMKIINGAPKQISITITSIIGKLSLKIKFDDTTINLELQRNQNVFNQKYQTIWPAIKYQLRKKILEYSVFKQNQSVLHFLKQDQSEQSLNEPSNKNHEIISESKLIAKFGSINQDELNQISMALTFTSKFIDSMLYYKKTSSGWNITFQQIFNEKLNFSLRQKHKNRENFDWKCVKNEIRLTRVQDLFLCGFLLIEEAIELKKNHNENQEVYFVQVSTNSRNFFKMIKYRKDMIIKIRFFKQINMKEGGHKVEIPIRKSIPFQRPPQKKCQSELQLEIQFQELTHNGIKKQEYINFVVGIIQQSKYEKKIQKHLLQFFQKLIYKRNCIKQISQTSIKVGNNYKYLKQKQFPAHTWNAKDNGEFNALPSVYVVQNYDSDNKVDDESQCGRAQVPFKSKVNRLDSNISSERKKNDHYHNFSMFSINDKNIQDFVIEDTQTESPDSFGYYSNYADFKVTSYSQGRFRLINNRVYDVWVFQIDRVFDLNKLWKIEIWDIKKRSPYKMYLSRKDIQFFIGSDRVQNISQKVLALASEIHIHRNSAISKLFLFYNNIHYGQILKQISDCTIKPLLAAYHPTQFAFSHRIIKLSTSEITQKGKSKKIYMYSQATCCWEGEWHTYIKLFWKRNKFQLAGKLPDHLIPFSWTQDIHEMKKIIIECDLENFIKKIQIKSHGQEIICELNKEVIPLNMVTYQHRRKGVAWTVELVKEKEKFKSDTFSENDILRIRKRVKGESRFVCSDSIKNIRIQERLDYLAKNIHSQKKRGSLGYLSQYYFQSFQS